jgi:biopolymer transport protein ExbD
MKARRQKLPINLHHLIVVMLVLFTALLIVAYFNVVTHLPFPHPRPY